jgi:hypothetical protein
MLKLEKGVWRMSMVRKSSFYDETKATQVAAFLLRQNDGCMNLLKFIKIMYNIEREALKRWSYPVTHSNICSMREGQVLSEIYDNTKPKKHRPVWNEYIDTNRKTNTVSLKKECPVGKLCKAEVDLIREIYQRDKDKSINLLVDEHHKYPEYVDPGDSSIETDFDKLLSLLGKTPEQISTCKRDMQGVAYLKEITA